MVRFFLLRPGTLLRNMGDQEFERVVQEGLAALKKSRERLKSDRDKPPDWEEITPEPLRPAVKHIRREFETAAWQLSEQVECACYVCLHPELTTSPTYKDRSNLIQADLRETWHLQFEGMTESERFSHWTKQYGELLKRNAVAPFNSFLKVGLAQESRLQLPAVEWAKTLTRGLLFSLRWTVPHLIKKMCDEQKNKLDLDISSFDAWCGWVDWRAPAFVFMQPSGNAPYNAAMAWQRAEDAEFTEQLLRGLTSKMLDPAWFHVDKLAGEAYVSLACVPHDGKAEANKQSEGVAAGLEMLLETAESSTKAFYPQNADESTEPEASPNGFSSLTTGGEIAQAQERIRHFEGQIAAVETNITAFQRSLTEAVVRGASTFKPRDIAKAISKLHADKKELEFRRDDWQIILNGALKREAEVPKQSQPGDGANANNQLKQSDEPSVGTANRTAQSKAVSNLRFDSPIKKAIFRAFSADPDASALQICRRFDKSGLIELPKNWTTGSNRLFEQAYKDPNHRRKIEKTISKVKSEMRKKELLS
jgi:hypothetical protein